MSNVPKLRFKEFSDEWESIKLGELGSFKGGGTPSTTVEKYWIGDIPWVSSSDISDNDIKNINVTRYINKTSIKESATKLIPKGSILFVSRVGVGKVAIASTDLCTSQDFTSLTLKNDDSQYIGYYFLANKNLLIRYSQGTSIKGFTTNDIKTLKLNLPSKPEQEKIASFLTSVDTKIEQLTKKEALLQQYKKGVMQAIFAGGKKAVNKKAVNSEELIVKSDGDDSKFKIKPLRFRQNDGSGFPEWVEKKLGEVFKFLRGSTLSKSDLVENGITKCIHYGELFTVYKEKVKDVVSSTNLTDGQMSMKGDILMPSSDVTPLGLATASAIFEDDVIIGGDTNILRPRSELDSLYVSYYLNYNKKDIIRLVTGTTVKHIYNKDVSLVKLPFPECEEQTKIANFLSSIDTKIEQVQKQLDSTKIFKRGLLQQMFV